MRRRDLLLASAALAAAPLARAQRPGRTYRVGMLIPVSVTAMPLYRAALAGQLARHGFVEGRNLAIDARTAVETFHEDRQTARELLAAKPDALFTAFVNPTSAALSAVKGTPTPVVFAWVFDPIATGFVQSYARPGGNATGVTNRAAELHAKRVELALELVPGARRIAIYGGYVESLGELLLAEARKVAESRGVEILRLTAKGSMERELAGILSEGARAVIVIFPSTSMPVALDNAIGMMRAKGVPSIFIDAGSVERGGLISLGTNDLDDIRRGADLLAKVLRGEKPATIPVDQAARFEMVVNLKTAREMGLTIPQSVLVRADRVIE